MTGALVIVKDPSVEMGNVKKTSNSSLVSTNLLTHLEIREVESDAELMSCLSLERRLGEAREAAREEGFLIKSGDTLESYLNYRQFSKFYLAIYRDMVVGFVYLFPPQSPLLQERLEADRYITQYDFNLREMHKVGWLAKIAVEPEFMGHGIAGALLDNLFQTCRGLDVISTIAFAPLRNLPSERLHKRHGFFQIGIGRIRGRDAVKHLLYSVYFRRAT